MYKMANITSVYIDHQDIVNHNIWSVALDELSKDDVATLAEQFCQEFTAYTGMHPILIASGRHMDMNKYLSPYAEVFYLSDDGGRVMWPNGETYLDLKKQVEAKVTHLSDPLGLEEYPALLTTMLDYSRDRGVYHLSIPGDLSIDLVELDDSEKKYWRRNVNELGDEGTMLEDQESISCAIAGHFVDLLREHDGCGLLYQEYGKRSSEDCIINEIFAIYPDAKVFYYNCRSEELHRIYWVYQGDYIKNNFDYADCRKCGRHWQFCDCKDEDE